jgi:zinc transport system substrate-binding protein
MTLRPWLAGAGLLLALAVPLAGCKTKQENPWSGPGPRVLTSFPPVYCLAASVAGPDATVQVIMTERGPHDHEYSPTDAVKLEGATLFFINGLGLDDTVAKKMIDGSSNKQVKLVELGEGLPKDLLKEMECDHDHEGHDHKHEHGADPHVWLGIPQLVKMTERVRDELSAADPAHAAGYAQRAQETAARFQKLQDDGKAMLKGKTERRLISFHESLGYFAKSFDLEIVASVEPKAGVEPTTPWLKKVIETSKQKRVRVIATEPQYSSNTSAETVLRELRRANPELGAEFVVIDPVETAPAADLKPDYLERKLRENLERLAATLK